MNHSTSLHSLWINRDATQNNKRCFLKDGSHLRFLREACSLGAAYSQQFPLYGKKGLSAHNDSYLDQE
jgi:hypothetical protein